MIVFRMANIFLHYIVLSFWKIDKLSNRATTVFFAILDSLSMIRYPDNDHGYANQVYNPLKKGGGKCLIISPPDERV